MSVFAAKGFDGATSKELASAAGVSEALLYRHFTSKEAIYLELVTLIGGRKDASVSQMTAAPPSSEAFIQTTYFLGRFILFGSPNKPGDDRIDRLMAQSLLGDGRFARAFLETMFHPLLPYLESCLRAAWESGDIATPNPPAELEMTFAHHFFGAIALFRLPEPSLVGLSDPEETLNATLLFAFRGVGFSQEAIARLVDFERLRRTFLQAMQGHQKP